jgi:hypothetical protein
MLMRFLSILSVCVLSFGLAGCQPASAPASKGSAASGAHGHDHGHGHQHPETLAEAVQQVGQCYTAIKAAFEKGSPEDAHDQMHDIGHLLDEELPDLLEKSTLPAEVKEKAKSSLSALFDGFGKLDSMMHNGPKVDFADIDKSLSTAVAELNGLVK